MDYCFLVLDSALWCTDITKTMPLRIGLVSTCILTALAESTVRHLTTPYMLPARDTMLDLQLFPDVHKARYLSL